MFGAFFGLTVKLKNEFEKQARRIYSVGGYTLGKLNEYGRRISVQISLSRKDKNEYAIFLTGWMVYPDGKIILTTPYGGM